MPGLLSPIFNIHTAHQLHTSQAADLFRHNFIGCVVYTDASETNAKPPCSAFAILITAKTHKTHIIQHIFAVLFQDNLGYLEPDSSISRCLRGNHLLITAIYHKSQHFLYKNVHIASLMTSFCIIFGLPLGLTFYAP